MSPATSVITLEVGSPNVLSDKMAKSKEAVWPLCKLILWLLTGLIAVTTKSKVEESDNSFPANLLLEELTVTYTELCVPGATSPELTGIEISRDSNPSNAYEFVVLTTHSPW